MSDGQSAFAEPMTMQEALATADSLISSEAKEVLPEKPSQEAEEEIAQDVVEADADAEASDEVDEPDAGEEESEQILTVQEYGEVLIDVNGTPTPLAKVVQGTLMQADYSRKTAALRQREREVETQLQEKMAELSARQQQLDEFEAEQDDEPDWMAIAAEDPLGYPELKEQWAKKQAAKDARKREAEQRREAAQRQFLQQTATKAVEVFPEWREDGVFEKGTEARLNAAIANGFTEEEYKSTPDMRIAVLLEKAARYDAMQSDTTKKRVAADKKLAKATKVIRPGASQGEVDPQTQRREALSKRLQKPTTTAQLAKQLGLR